MNWRKRAMLALAVAAAAAAGWLANSSPARLPAQPAAAGGQPDAKKDTPEMAAVKKTAADFAKAFDAGDAKAVAAFWTEDGEFFGPDRGHVKGRAELEKTYTEFFKSHPKSRIEISPESVRLLGKHTALEEGSIKVIVPGEKAPEVTRYSALHVRDGDAWKVATVREWLPDAAELVSLNDLAWLVGDWHAKGPGGEVKITYAWDKDKTTIQGHYVLTRDGKQVNKGTQIIGRDPASGLRSWVFDSNGTFGESAWERDENRWLIEAAGTLPDGSSLTATNILIPLGKDAFTWQSVDRTAAGVELPNTPPVRVTRVQAGK